MGGVRFVDDGCGGYGAMMCGRYRRILPAMQGFSRMGVVMTAVDNDDATSAFHFGFLV
jgi:hypothetical protein